MEKQYKKIEETTHREGSPQSITCQGWTDLESKIILSMPIVLFFSFMFHALVASSYEQSPQSGSTEKGKLEFIEIEEKEVIKMAKEKKAPAAKKKAAPAKPAKAEKKAAPKK